MKRFIVLLIITALLFSSCIYFIPVYYGFYFQNDSNVDIFCIMDYYPADEVITQGSYRIIAKQGCTVSCALKDRDCFEKYINDSVYIYVAYLDSLRNPDGSVNLNYDAVKDSYIIARMTLWEDDIIDPTHNSPMKTVYFPPRENSGIPIVYYDNIAPANNPPASDW